MRKAVPFEVTKLVVSKRQAFWWWWFHQIKLFLLHTCSLKLVSSDSESDNSLSKYSSNFPLENGRFSRWAVLQRYTVLTSFQVYFAAKTLSKLTVCSQFNSLLRLSSFWESHYTCSLPYLVTQLNVANYRGGGPSKLSKNL